MIKKRFIFHFQTHIWHWLKILCEYFHRQKFENIRAKICQLMVWLMLPPNDKCINRLLNIVNGLKFQINVVVYMEFTCLWGLYTMYPGLSVCILVFFSLLLLCHCMTERRALVRFCEAFFLYIWIILLNYRFFFVSCSRDSIVVPKKFHQFNFNNNNHF